MDDKEKSFTHDGEDYYFKKMSAQQLAEGRKLYAKTFKMAVEDGAILKKSLDDHMRRQGLWDDHKQDEYTNLIKKSADLEYRVKSGQFKKASELKAKALELKSIRDDISSLMSVRNSMDSITAEGQADQEQFNYFIFCSIYDYKTRKQVFSSFDDYVDRSDSDFGRALAEKFAAYFYDLDDDFENNLLENKILKKLNLINKEGFLVNSKGERVDIEGNLIDEEGARIDTDGTRIDINNNPILGDDTIDNLEFEDDLSPKNESKPKEDLPPKVAPKAAPKKKRKAKSVAQE